MSFGGQRTATPKFAPKGKANVTASKRINFGDDEDVDDEPIAEAVTGFEDNKIQHLHEKAKPKEIVIPSLPNKDFRKEAAAKRSIYVPESGVNGEKNAGPSQPEVLGQQVAQYGLQVTKKTKETVKVDENGSSEMQVEETTTDTVTAPTHTLEEAAVAALVREANSDEEEEPTSNLVIPSELDVFRHDVQNRPEETTLEEYDEVPVEQFGAALLRGMGWKEGQSLGGGKAGASEPLAAKNFVRRDALLGLGAKPEDLPESDRQNRRRAYEFSDTNLLVPRLKESSRGSSRSSTPVDDRRRHRTRSRSPSQRTSSSRHRSRSPQTISGQRDSRDRSPKRSRRERSRSNDRYRRSRDDDDRDSRRRR
ncbi:DExH-box splicing factor binding site-domain-containing protein [Umbelopsis sp. PMI_123]|nr:DExH-box splicing factor binding site-domain-containing protein [Umbelopsis sp. PMI_123]